MQAIARGKGKMPECMRFLRNTADILNRYAAGEITIEQKNHAMQQERDRVFPNAQIDLFEGKM